MLPGTCSAVFGLPLLLAKVPRDSQVWHGWNEEILAWQRPSLHVDGEIWLTHSPQVCAGLRNMNDENNNSPTLCINAGWGECCLKSQLTFLKYQCALHYCGNLALCQHRKQNDL